MSYDLDPRTGLPLPFYGTRPAAAHRAGQPVQARADDDKRKARRKAQRNARRRNR